MRPYLHEWCTGDHFAADVGHAQLAYDGRRFRFQRILHDQQSQKVELALDLVAFHAVHLVPGQPAIQLPVSQRQHSETANGVIAQNGGVVGR